MMRGQKFQKKRPLLKLLKQRKRSARRSKLQSVAAAFADIRRRVGA